MPEAARRSASAAAACRPELTAYLTTDSQAARAMVTAAWCTMNARCVGVAHV